MQRGPPNLRTAPLDSRLRGNDESGPIPALTGQLKWAAGSQLRPPNVTPAEDGVQAPRYWRWTASSYNAGDRCRGVRQASAPPLWIPACAGMTNGTQVVAWPDDIEIAVSGTYLAAHSPRLWIRTRSGAQATPASQGQSDGGRSPGSPAFGGGPLRRTTHAIDAEGSAKPPHRPSGFPPPRE